MIEPARLGRTADGTPYSGIYDDIYHARAGGPGQARHVFITGNGLPQRWQGQGRRFVIAETGFGMGLNFLATWDTWRNDPLRGERLHFVSIEKHPFTVNDLAALHAAWPELALLASELRAQWPTLVPGLHRLQFDNGTVVLDLVFGDAVTHLPHWRFQADAFYLDGFSPTKNPELWHADLLQTISHLAAPGATLATWSVAATIREALHRQGWQLEKRPGFAGKREMLCGAMPGLMPPRSAPDRRAIVLGAGLAGSTAANRLAARGWRVTLIDERPGPGEGASGNRAGVLRPLPSRDDNPLARITRAGFLAASRHLQSLAAISDKPLWGRTGVLHLARDATHEEAQRHIVEDQQAPPEYLRFVTRDEAEHLCGWPVDSGGWWFPGGAWVSPAQYCRTNLAQFGDTISARFTTPVAQVAQIDGHWHALDEAGGSLANAPHLVVANAADARRLLGDWLPIFPARGQVTHLPAEPESRPRCVVCRLGYVTPAIGGERYAGATFTMKDADPSIRAADHAENLAKLDFMLPGFSEQIAPAHLAGRVGFRPASPDRLPIVGAVPKLGDAPAAPGLWLVDGFGARGIVWSALAGELIADLMESAPTVLEQDLVTTLSPARFLDRRYRRHPK